MSTYVIAEIGINHNGSEELCRELITQAYDSGVDAVKFQKRTIDVVYIQEELDKPRESPWGVTNREQKEGLEFSIEQYKEIKQYCDELGIDFIISCWDQGSVDEVGCLDVKYHKIASALATDKEFLEKVNETGKPVILSTGMCTEDEIEAAIKILDNVEHVLCCTATLQKKHPNLKIGFSNHYNGHDACVAATALGAECVEFHITHDRTAYGSDQSASIENSKCLVDAVRKVGVMLGDGVKVVYGTEVPVAKKLRKVSNTHQ
mgnify:CR=1 FL=1